MKPVFIVAMAAVVMIGMMIPNISAQDFSDKTTEPSFFSNIFKFFDSWFPENNSKSNLKSTDTSYNISAEDKTAEDKTAAFEAYKDTVSKAVVQGKMAEAKSTTQKVEARSMESIAYKAAVSKAAVQAKIAESRLGLYDGAAHRSGDGSGGSGGSGKIALMEQAAEAISAADNVETHNAFKSDSPSYNSPSYNSPSYNSPSYNSPSYNSPSYNSPSYNSPSSNPSVEPKNANPLGTITINTSPHFSSFPEITKKNLNSPSFNVGNFDQPSLPPSLPPVYDSPRTPEPAYNPAKEAARSGIGQNSQPAYSAPYVPNPFLIEK